MAGVCNETYDKFCFTGHHTTVFGLKMNQSLTDQLKKEECLASGPENIIFVSLLVM